MGHPALFVQGGHRLGPRPLADRGPHVDHGRPAADRPEHRPDHLPALIDLGHDRGRAPGQSRRLGPPRPAVRRQSPRRPVRQHHRPRDPVHPPSAHNHDAAGVPARRRRRIHPHDHPLEAGGHRRLALAAPHLQRPPGSEALLRPAVRHHRGGEQGPVDLHDPPLQLLRRPPRPAVTGRQLLQKPRRQMRRIVRRRRMGGHARSLVPQPDQRPRRPGRRRHHQPRPLAQPQPHPQQGQGLPRPPRARRRPGAELVRPGRRELRPSQTVRILGRKGLRHRSVRKQQPPPRRLEPGPVRPRPARQRPDPRHPLDHDLAHVVQGRPDQRQPASGGLHRPIAQPHGPGQGLARPAPAQEEPGRPVAPVGTFVGRPLRRPQHHRRRRDLLRLVLRRRPDQTHLRLAPPGGQQVTDPLGHGDQGLDVMRPPVPRRLLQPVQDGLVGRVRIVPVEHEGQFPTDHPHRPVRLKLGHRRRRPLGQPHRVRPVLLAHLQHAGVAMDSGRPDPVLGGQRADRLSGQPPVQQIMPRLRAHPRRALRQRPVVVPVVQSPHGLSIGAPRTRARIKPLFRAGL